MKRFAPFIIILAVAVLTLGLAKLMWRANRRALADRATVATPAKEIEGEPTHALGPKNAPVLLEEYGDFQCPACAATSEVIRSIKNEYGDRLRLVFWQLPLAMHSHSREAAIAAEAASRQGKFWEMHDQLYQNQNSWAHLQYVHEALEKLALGLELNMTRFQQDIRDPATAAQVDADLANASARGVKNTPTLFVNGTELPPPFEAPRLRAAIEAALANKTHS